MEYQSDTVTNRLLVEPSVYLMIIVPLTGPQLAEARTKAFRYLPSVSEIVCPEATTLLFVLEPVYGNWYGTPCMLICPPDGNWLAG